MDVGDRQVEHVGDRLHVLARDVSELLDHVVEHRHEGAPVGGVLGGDGAHERDPIGRGARLSWTAPKGWGSRTVTPISVYARHGPGHATGMTGALPGVVML